MKWGQQMVLGHLSDGGGGVTRLGRGRCCSFCWRCEELEETSTQFCEWPPGAFTLVVKWRAPEAFSSLTSDLLTLFKLHSCSFILFRRIFSIIKDNLFPEDVCFVQIEQRRWRQHVRQPPAADGRPLPDHWQTWPRPQGHTGHVGHTGDWDLWKPVRIIDSRIPVSSQMEWKYGTLFSCVLMENRNWSGDRSRRSSLTDEGMFVFPHHL